MNILHISSAKSWRGGERQVHFLLKGQVSIENTVSLMCPTRSPLKGKSINIIKEFIPFKRGAAGYPMNLMALLKVCREENIDIIHGHDSHAHSLIWMAYKMSALRTPSVVTRRLNNPIKDKSRSKYNHPSVKKIICISEAVQQKMAPQINDQNRLEIIHSGIDLSDKSSSKQIAADQLFTIGYVAAFTDEKDHQLFVEVAMKLLESNNNYRFLLVGDGPLLEETQKSVADYAKYFEFTGFVNNVNAEYSKMNLLLHTARSEALGTSILDGMKFGLPIVANDVGGIREIVKHGENGFLTRERNAQEMAKNVSEIRADFELYSSMSLMSLSLIEPFGVNEMVNKTMKLYEEILKL